MSIEVTRPTEGGVTITLPFNEAEVLLRAVGMVNAGNLREHAPTLMDVVNELLVEFGSSNKPGVRYGARLANGQAYIYDNENPPF